MLLGRFLEERLLPRVGGFDWPASILVEVAKSLRIFLGLLEPAHVRVVETDEVAHATEPQTTVEEEAPTEKPLVDQETWTKHLAACFANVNTGISSNWSFDDGVESLFEAF